MYIQVIINIVKEYNIANDILFDVNNERST